MIGEIIVTVVIFVVIPIAVIACFVNNNCESPRVYHPTPFYINGEQFWSHSLFI
jgi:hypothetical protein